MSLIVKDVYDWINEVAPFETAESYDNVGLLIGSMGSEISNYWQEKINIWRIISMQV